MASVEAREKFYHPYTPYDIQLQFMSSLYDCIDAGKVAIFESPTGLCKDAYSLHSQFFRRVVSNTFVAKALYVRILGVTRTEAQGLALINFLPKRASR